MSTRQPTFGPDVLERMQKALDRAPGRPPAEDPASGFTKLALVRALAPKLRTLHGRGWSWKQLTDILEREVPEARVSPELLSAYLRGKPKASAKTAKKKPEGETPANEDRAALRTRAAATSSAPTREPARASATVTPAAAPPKRADAPANETLVADKDVLDDEDQWAAEPTAVGGARR